ncbi:MULTISPECIES: type VI secretion system ATPase TssH [Sphingomonas]|uniref:Type VI secretion system ATPase TssH n=1 Tax=Sphingomonas adhaesiva TaxID=28212 RepID=A0A2A4I6G3_9SPHN|nr:MULTISPECIES: type VI secretion system ATPase TssH [Sphingomonas]PCG13352.1 type VI secretion system ATPase TssH [Sphingomonas adhaesiva]PZU80418.1 MAG: type VI secretion system ATPase TssH [Sphingomonas sp.]
MSEISRASLFGRLNTTALKAVETATGFCRMRGNPYVELVHWLHVLLQDPGNDVGRLRIAFGLDEARLAKDVLAALDALPRGATAVSDFSPQVEEAVEKGWLFASLQFGAAKVRGAHLIYAMLKTSTLRNALFAISPEWRKVNADKLGDGLETVCHASSETTETAAAAVARSAGEEPGPGSTGVTGNDALERFSIDLTAKAKSGEIDRIVGRDAEIRQVVDILLRRRQNNPILVGEAGVGKTAVVEGFARRVADGDVPPSLRNVTLRALDIGLLQAGASVKGEFEKRLRDVIDAVEQLPEPIILFIDEAHTLVGAGGQAGTGDAANLLKPALARGRLRTIAATTYAEYRQYFEKDPALTRRFQTVDVGEPETEVAVAMIRSVAPMMEAHHAVVVLDEAVDAAVRLSQRYIPARQLPDKAVSLLDTACARVAVSQHAVPAPVEDRRRRVELLEVERDIATREAANQYAGADRIAKLDGEIAAARETLAGVEAKWRAEMAAFVTVREARDALVAAREADEATAAQGAETALALAVAAMREAGGDAPMVFGVADADAVASVVGDWTGIPVGRMVKDEIASVLTIADQLKARVIGQDHAMDAIAKRIQTSRAKLDNPNKPVGVFMLCGPSGVGKTETAHALAELLYSGDDSLIVINMSEFQEAHTVSTLKGAPAGYVGYGQGGVLTEAVRRRPYSVVLLDEVEKAHPDVHEMFFQVFDKGFMNDSEGRFIDFKNTLILLTSNVGTDMVMSLTEDEELAPEPEGLAGALRPELLKVFPPALLGRLLVLPYYPLSPTMLQGIVRLQLNRVVKRVRENHALTLTYGQDVVDHIVARCTEVASGGRMIDAILTNTMLPDMSIALLERQMRGEEVAGIAVTIVDTNFQYKID